MPLTREKMGTNFSHFRALFMLWFGLERSDHFGLVYTEPSGWAFIEPQERSGASLFGIFIFRAFFFPQVC